jgi:hypothetical protein
VTSGKRGAAWKRTFESLRETNAVTHAACDVMHRKALHT